MALDDLDSASVASSGTACSAFAYDTADGEAVEAVDEFQALLDDLFEKRCVG